jgi:DNA-binding transcriptional ArsR family regulator
MPKQSHSVESTFSALSDPTRRAVVQRLCKGPATVSQLAGRFSMALPSFVQHLNVLERAGLLVSRKEGRVRTCQLNPAALGQAENWLAAHRLQWEERLDRLEAHIGKSRKGEEP